MANKSIPVKAAEKDAFFESRSGDRRTVLVYGPWSWPASSMVYGNGKANSKELLK